MKVRGETSSSSASSRPRLSEPQPESVTRIHSEWKLGHKLFNHSPPPLTPPPLTPPSRLRPPHLRPPLQTSSHFTPRCFILPSPQTSVSLLLLFCCCFRLCLLVSFHIPFFTFIHPCFVFLLSFSSSFFPCFLALILFSFMCLYFLSHLLLSLKTFCPYFLLCFLLSLPIYFFLFILPCPLLCFLSFFLPSLESSCFIALCPSIPSFQVKLVASFYVSFLSFPCVCPCFLLDLVLVSFMCPSFLPSMFSLLH